MKIIQKIYLCFYLTFMKLLFKLLLLVTVYLALPNNMVAQKKIFYDKDWQKTKEKKASYYRIVTPDGANFLVQDYFLPENQLQMEGKYTSSKLADVDRTGPFVYYYRNGKKSMEGEYKVGKNVGEWTYYYKEGAKKSGGNFEKGDKEGEWQYFHKNGKLKSKGVWLKDEKDGTWTFFFDNGEKEEEYNFSKGKKDGVYSEYFKIGKLKEKGKFEKDSLFGPYEEYWENGNLAAKGDYDDNKRNGSWEWFHENGKTSCKVDYKNGKFLNGNFYNEEGVKQSGKIYKDDLVESVEYTGGSEAMYSLIGKQLGRKLDLAGAKKAKYKFNGFVTLKIDEKGNITDREWILPDLEDDSFEDTWEVLENINAAIDDFPRFKPAIAYNRKIKTSYSFIYPIDFSKI
jgi:antitoxin component YwqK of YwqJK toxin-antitoxin module